MASDWICPECGRADATTLGPGALCPHDGRVLVDVDRAGVADGDPVLGRVVGGQYAVYDQLGRGGMGAVYRAVHLRLRRHVALKTILPDRIEEDTVELKARFEQEALMLSELRHPGIVTVYDFGEESGVLYMVLELIEGASLADALRKTTALPPARAIDITRQLVDALGEPHRRGLTHRDIKPSNIMLEPRPDGGERVVLIDFGVAKAKAGVMPEYGPTPRTQTGMAVGTPRYMAPEQLAGGDLGPWTDFYAVGVVLYRMLVGQSPFIGSPAEMIAAHLRDPVPPLPPQLGLTALDGVIAKAMAKKPAERHTDGRAFIGALDAAAAVMPGAAAYDIDLDPAQATVPMSPLTEAELQQALLTAREPTPSDFSSGWRGEVDFTGADVAVDRAFAKTRRNRWLIATAALLLMGVVIGALLASRDDARPLATGTAPAEAPPAASAGTAPTAPDPSTGPETPVAEAPDAALEPDATPAKVEAAPTVKAAPAPAQKAPAAAPSKAPTTRKVAARKRANRRGPTPDQLARNVRRMIDACRCGDAERNLKALRRVDSGAAGKLDDPFTNACGLIGVGCLNKGPGSAP